MTVDEIRCSTCGARGLRVGGCVQPECPARQPYREAEARAANVQPPDDATLLRWIIALAPTQILAVCWGVSNDACLIGADVPDRVRKTIAAAMREYGEPGKADR